MLQFWHPEIEGSVEMLFLKVRVLLGNIYYIQGPSFIHWFMFWWAITDEGKAWTHLHWCNPSLLPHTALLLFGCCECLLNCAFPSTRRSSPYNPPPASTLLFALSLLMKSQPDASPLITMRRGRFRRERGCIRFPKVFCFVNKHIKKKKQPAAITANIMSGLANKFHQRLLGFSGPALFLGDWICSSYLAAGGDFSIGRTSRG